MTTNHMWTFAECARMRQIIATDYPFPKYLDFDEVARKLNQEFPSNVPFAEAMCYTMNWAIEHGHSQFSQRLGFDDGGEKYLKFITEEKRKSNERYAEKRARDTETPRRRKWSEEEIDYVVELGFARKERKLTWAGVASLVKEKYGFECTLSMANNIFYTYSNVSPYKEKYGKKAAFKYKNKWKNEEGQKGHPKKRMRREEPAETPVEPSGEGETTAAAAAVEQSDEEVDQLASDEEEDYPQLAEQEQGLEQDEDEEIDELDEE
ncbi:hypothetical protein JCM10049v2_003500 [Rhodotorula toruloides]